MMRSQDEDLGAWEAGELTLEEAAARHPGGDIAQVAALHERLGALAAAPTPDPKLAWRGFEAKLAPSAPRAEGSRFRPRRVLVAALAAAVLSGSVALAAPGAVRGWVDSIRRGVGAVLGEGDEPPTPPAPPSGSGALVPPPAGHAQHDDDEQDGGSPQGDQEGADHDRDGGAGEQAAPEDQDETDGAGEDESSGERSGEDSSTSDEASPSGSDDVPDPTD